MLIVIVFFFFLKGGPLSVAATVFYNSKVLVVVC